MSVKVMTLVRETSRPGDGDRPESRPELIDWADANPRRVLTPITHAEWSQLPRHERWLRARCANRVRDAWHSSNHYRAWRSKHGLGTPCATCGATDRAITADHIVPLVRGGWHEDDNLRPLCGSCNSRKGTR